MGLEHPMGQMSPEDSTGWDEGRLPLEFQKRQAQSEESTFERGGNSSKKMGTAKKSEAHQLEENSQKKKPPALKGQHRSTKDQGRDAKLFEVTVMDLAPFLDAFLNTKDDPLLLDCDDFLGS